MNQTEKEKLFEEKQKALLEDIPPEFHRALSYWAWEEGHSAGYDEVLNILQDLVHTFQDPIIAFQNRLWNEYNR